MQKVKVAITGGSGFLGSYVIKKLKNKRISYSSFDRTHHDLAEISSLKSLLEGKDIIIHLAGISKKGTTKQINDINVNGTRNLLEAALKYSPRAKIIFASSFQVYALADTFGKSKKRAEEILEKYVRMSELKAIILRFTNFYGVGGKPYNHMVLNTFAKLIQDGKEITLDGDGTQKRDYLYITDAADAVLKSLEYSQKNDVEYFDICTGKKTSLNQVISLMERISKKKVRVAHRQLEKQVDFIFNYTNKKAKNKLNWSPELKLSDGLKLLLRRKL